MSRMSSRIVTPLAMAALLAAARTGLGPGSAALPSAVVPRDGALDAVLGRFVEAAQERPQE